MRGRANNEVVRLAKARKHAKRSYYCSCGKVVRGNGGKTAHTRMHEQRGEWRQPGDPPDTEHRYLSEADFHARFPPVVNAWTDYPISALGDESQKEAPIRACRVLSYDGDRYCVVEVEGLRETIKSGYLYTIPARSAGDAPCLSKDTLHSLPVTKRES